MAPSRCDVDKDNPPLAPTQARRLPVAAGMIDVVVNERPLSVPEGTTAGTVRDRLKPGADVLVVNGFPSPPEAELSEGDEVVLIRCGEIPDERELERFMVARHTPRVHEVMKRATVGIAGLGGLGSNVAIALGRMGIGRLILADFDVVEPTNLNRQQFAPEHLGLNKTDAMKGILGAINPYIEVEAHNVVLDRGNVPEIFGRAEIVVECFDRPEAKSMIIAAVSDAMPDTYVIGASGVAGYGKSNDIRTMRLGKKIFIVGDLVTAAEPGRGLMAPRVGIAAHHQANLVVALLMDPDAPEL
jgi:sulfur carrier protein ThiS adenylyltransferase